MLYSLYILKTKHFQVTAPPPGPPWRRVSSGGEWFCRARKFLLCFKYRTNILNVKYFYASVPPSGQQWGAESDFAVHKFLDQSLSLEKLFVFSSEWWSGEQWGRRVILRGTDNKSCLRSPPISLSPSHSLASIETSQELRMLSLSHLI